MRRGEQTQHIHTKSSGPSESAETRQLVAHAFVLAQSLAITTLLVQADELTDIRLVEKSRGKQRIVWLTRSDIPTELLPASDIVLRIPTTHLTRMSQMKMGLFLAVSNAHIDVDTSVLCLSGIAGSERLDTLMITNPQRDFPWFRKHPLRSSRTRSEAKQLARLLDIAIQLAAEGREGHPIGTIFVLGAPQELAPYLRQLVLNPCHGHPARERTIHRPQFFETLREFAALDGAFIVNPRGVVESAGTYLDAPTRKARLAPGLGARHAGAAAITAQTSAFAVVVSSSSGTVTVFRNGQTVLELEQPDPYWR